VAPSFDACTFVATNDSAIKNAEKAKAIIRGETFYDIDQLEWAIHVFREVTSVISMVYFPARICIPPMETDLSYKVFVSSEVMDAVNDTQVNIYRDVFEHLVKPVIEQEQPDVVGNADAFDSAGESLSENGGYEDRSVLVAADVELLVADDFDAAAMTGRVRRRLLFGVPTASVS